MPKIRYKKLCVKCKNYFLPDSSKQARWGYCSNCRIIPGRCKALTETGYQCSEKPTFFGFCLTHFMKEPINRLKEE
ncbi:hypothetical protein HYT58_02480, partial [Candidatus Woesearchaeota archaeon]|nr:hypothetical protein [Candidatus Woesearchaeota archaeon]